MGKPVVAISMAAIFFLFTFFACLPLGWSGFDYRDALEKSILFYEAQRSGVLPDSQRVTWRSDSGLKDGEISYVDLVGGYYDAGDNVKFGFPFAFTMTMLSWSIIDYEDELKAANQLSYALDALKWGTDYLLKANPKPLVLYGQVGDGESDHKCWERPENMTTSRQAYAIDDSKPGSDLAAESSAAMAAASMAFKNYNQSYSKELLSHSKQLFTFADNHRGLYSDVIFRASEFYKSSGYNDELLWASAWLYHATRDVQYMQYLAGDEDQYGASSWPGNEFSWDVKYPGFYALATKFLIIEKDEQYSTPLKRCRDKLENLLCSFLGFSATNVQKTPAGLLFFQNWNNMHLVTTSSFLAVVYSDHLRSAYQDGFSCSSGKHVSSHDLFTFAKSQVDYILGSNPKGTSYMVGFGSEYPLMVHHRGASISPCYGSSCVADCSGGFSKWFYSTNPNPNVLSGALVGGPGSSDDFDDERSNYEQTEPTIYNNAPLVGLLAKILANTTQQHTSRTYNTWP